VTESIPPLHVVLVEPEIPPNTGNIARLCAATGCRLHLIEPLGFQIDDRSLKRAGMDYWQFVDHKVWKDLTTFFETEKPAHFHLATTKTKASFWDVRYQPGDYLIFGRETKGLPESLLEKYAPHCINIPMANPEVRSLNLATSVGIVVYEALRQIKE